MSGSTGPADRSVSVVVPTHRRRALLQRTLLTVLRQQDVDLEVVVVVDGVLDDTLEMLEALGDPRVRVVVHETAHGVAAARNAGLAVASGAWTGFCDDDDLWLPDKLSRQLAALDAAPGSAWAVGSSVSVDEDLRQPYPDPAFPADALDPGLLRRNMIAAGASNVVASTALLRDLGGCDTSLQHLADWDLWIRLVLSAPAAVDPSPLLAYLRHTGGMSRTSGVLEEFTRLGRKHAAARRERGVGLDEEFLLGWVAEMQARGGRRLVPARLHLGLARRRRDPREVARAAVVLAAPRLLSQRRDARAETALPAPWRDRVLPWLEELREHPLHRALVATG